MNRRSFIDRMAIGAASFMILPGAGRVWRARRVMAEPACLTDETRAYQDCVREYLGEYLLQLARKDHADGSVDLKVMPMRWGQVDHVTIKTSVPELDRITRLEGQYATIWKWPE